MTYKKPSQVPHELRQALYGHELMRRLGFTPDEIFVGIQDRHVFVKVQRGPERYYAFKVSPTALNIEQLESKWPAAVKLWNDTCASDASWNYEGSDVRAMAVNIAAAVLDAGLEIRKPN